MKVFITGGGGYVGRHLTERLIAEGVINVCGLRAPLSASDMFFESRVMGDIAQLAINSDVFKGISTVVHLANIASLPAGRNESDAKKELYAVNVKGTENVLRCAAHNGVQRFIYISSLKAVGEQCKLSERFTEQSIPTPEGAYGESKLAAEQLVKSLAPTLGMEYVIIRPPLVYGPGAGGNFYSIVRLVDKRVPLPFKSINNVRSMVYIGNLVDLIIRCLDCPEASNKVLMVSDDQDLSLPSILQHIACGLKKNDLSFPFPQGLLYWMANLVGKRQLAQKLFGTLVVDISTTKSLLGWQPPYTVEQGMKVTLEYNRSQRSKFE